MGGLSGVVNMHDSVFGLVHGIQQVHTTKDRAGRYLTYIRCWSTCVISRSVCLSLSPSLLSLVVVLFVVDERA